MKREVTAKYSHSECPLLAQSGHSENQQLDSTTLQVPHNGVSLAAVGS
jgi:hypothetical protein